MIANLFSSICEELVPLPVRRSCLEHGGVLSGVCATQTYGMYWRYYKGDLQSCGSSCTLARQINQLEDAIQTLKARGALTDPGRLFLASCVRPAMKEHCVTRTVIREIWRRNVP